METMGYYSLYKELKFHFLKPNYFYGSGNLPLDLLWNREREIVKRKFESFSLKYRSSEFFNLLVSTFIYEPHTYATNLDSEENLERFRKFNIWWSNPSYYFKKDIDNIVNERDEEVRIETFILLANLFHISADWYDDKKEFFSKYFYLIYNVMHGINMEEIENNEEIKNLIKQLTGEKQ